MCDYFTIVNSAGVAVGSYSAERWEDIQDGNTVLDGDRVRLYTDGGALIEELSAEEFRRLR